LILRREKAKAATKAPKHKSKYPPSAITFDFAQGGGTKKAKAATKTPNHQIIVPPAACPLGAGTKKTKTKAKKSHAKPRQNTWRAGTKGNVGRISRSDHSITQRPIKRHSESRPRIYFAGTKNPVDCSVKWIWC
jgi:hypothetical protein